MALRNFLTAEGLFGPKSMKMSLIGVFVHDSIDVSCTINIYAKFGVAVVVGLFGLTGANQFLGAAIGKMVATPDLGGASEFWNIFRYHVAPNKLRLPSYPSILCVGLCWLVCVLEKFFHKKVHHQLTLHSPHCCQ